jgi:hypothetical protein
MSKKHLVGLATVLIAATVASGWLLEPTQEITLAVNVAGAPAEVYRLVSDPRQPWRSSLASVTVHDSVTWTEQPDRGAPIRFVRTAADPGRRFAVSFASSSFSGTWEGRFESLGADSTRLTFIEQVSVPSPWLRSISRLFFGPERAMQKYTTELREATAVRVGGR